MKSNTDTEIQFSGLKPGHYEYAYLLDKEFFETFENENLCDGTVNFSVLLDKTEREMVFSFSFHGLMKTTCDRCLEEIEVPVEGQQQLTVMFSDDPKSECDSEDEVILPSSAFKIDLAQWMYEYVAVAMPIRNVHPDDEEGNPTCNPEMLRYIQDQEQPHINEVDPRWAKLLELK